MSKRFKFRCFISANICVAFLLWLTFVFMQSYAYAGILDSFRDAYNGYSEGNSSALDDFKDIKKTGTIVFNGNNHEGKMDSVTVSPGDEYTIPGSNYKCEFWESFDYWSSGDKIYHQGDKMSIPTSMSSGTTYTLKANYKINQTYIVCGVLAACFIAFLVVLITLSNRRRQMTTNECSKPDAANHIDTIDKESTETSSTNISEIDNFSVADEISKFKKLMDDGVITEEEFQAKKHDLLKR